MRTISPSRVVHLTPRLRGTAGLSRCMSPQKRHVARAESEFASRPEGEDEFKALQGKKELAKQLKAEVLSKFHDAGVKIFMISIGPADRGFKFHELTGFPTEYLLADPENVTYSALGLKSDTFSAFFSPETPKALWRRIREDGAGTLKEVLGPWIKKGFFIPPKSSQAKNQGATLVFQGKKTLWRYDDPATSAHASPKQILEEGLKDL